MNREEVKNLLPVMQAFADGKEIQSKTLTGNWIDVTNPDWDMARCYRIKPEPTYRPFRNTEECWEEMQKHQPFGWIKKISGHRNFLYIIEFYPTGIVINDVDILGGFRNLLKTYNFAFTETTFADGTPFGVKE